MVIIITRFIIFLFFFILTTIEQSEIIARCQLTAAGLNYYPFKELNEIISIT